MNFCESLLKNGIKIEYVCDMFVVCIICYVVVCKGFDSLEEMNDVEVDLLDCVWGLEFDFCLFC